MEIKLNQAETEEVFFNCLCDNDLYIHDLEIVSNSKAYNDARDNWIKLNDRQFPTIEDVWMQILKDGGKLGLKDWSRSEQLAVVTLEELQERMSKAPSKNLMNVLEGNYDVTDTDVILQTIFYGEVIFG
jgi:hypothetical protein